MDTTLQAMHAMADAAERETLALFRTAFEAEDKAGRTYFDPVTAADRQAERVMRDIIAERFPDDGIVGEEEEDRAGTSGRVWVLDPIDGTRAYIAGLPSWGTLIGLRDQRRALAGMLAQPYTGERFWSDGRSAHHSDRRGARRLSTRPCRTLGDATLMTTSPALFEDVERKAYDTLEARARNVRYGFDCYAYGMLAMGCVDLVVEAGLRSFDILALIPIIEAAGGVVTGWRGESAMEGGRVIAAGDAHAHADALAVLSKA